MNKILGLLVCTLMIFSYSSVHADDSDTGLSPKEIYEGFNLRSIRSSLGQQLKSNCYSTFKDFYGDDIQATSNIVTLDTAGDTLKIISDSWSYVVKISNDTEPFEIEFIDEALQGSYYSLSHYKVDFDKETGLWAAISHTSKSYDSNKKLYEQSSSPISQDNWIEMPEGCEG